MTIILFGQQTGFTQTTNLLPFMANEVEPEMFFMDPVYNDKGKIMYYSYGGVLKVQYEYNADGKPKQKMTYILDKHDCDWAVFTITNFGYKDGRLCEEKTKYHLSYEDPLFIDTKTIRYDPNNHTDTINSNIEKITRHHIPGSPSDQLITTVVRYLNKANMPDSIITTERYRNGAVMGKEDSDERTDLHRMIKVCYDYDSKNRLISGDAFVKGGFDTLWYDSYNFKIDYNKNKTEWTQISKGIDMAAYFEYGRYEEIKTILKYTITTDSKNRILSKLLTANGDVILSSKYSYDSQGQMTARVEQNLKSRYIESLGMSELFFKGLGRDIESLRYTTQGKANCMYTEFYLGTADEKFEKKLELTVCTQPENGQMLAVDLIRYDEGKVDDISRSSYRYLADGLVERTEYGEDYDKEEFSLIAKDKVLYQKDGEGRILYEETSRYSSDDKRWNAKDKKIVRYDEVGNKISIERYEYTDNTYFRNPYSEPFIGWAGKEYNVAKYDSAGRVLESLDKYWNDRVWVNDVLKRYLYTSKGEISLRESYEWDNDEKIWKGTSRDSLAYNDRGEECLKISYKWLTDAKRWKPKDKVETEKTGREDEYMNKPYKAQTTYYDWINGTWQPYSQYVENREPSGSYLDMKSVWNAETKAWYIERKESKVIDGMSTHVEIYRWDYEDNRLKGIENYTKITLSQGVYDSQTIYRVWDDAKTVWKDSLTCYLLSGKDYRSKAYVYQLYDENAKSWKYTKKVESKDSGETSLLQQYIWNSQTADWQPESKIVYYTKDNISDSYKSEVYSYNLKSKEWIPQYSCENINFEGEYDRRHFSYSFWDIVNKNWVRSIAINNSGYSYISDYYLWDKIKGKWVKQAAEGIDKVRKIESDIDRAYNSISYETEYRSLMNKRNY